MKRCLSLLLALLLCAALVPALADATPNPIPVLSEDEITPTPKGIHHYMLICLDSWAADIHNPGHTDGLILVTVDEYARRVMLTSFIRDMLIQRPDGKFGRLNNIVDYFSPAIKGGKDGQKGIEELIKTLNTHFNLEIDHYIVVDFQQVQNIIDAVGGVDITITDREATYLKNYSISSTSTTPSLSGGGTYHFSGHAAVIYMRIRKVANIEGETQDVGRTRRSRTVLTTIADIDLPALVAYGKERGVGIILWTVFNVLDDQLDAACDKYAAMGIKGFKVDFLDRNDQEAMQMIYRIAKRCAESRLILDYHGIFAPQGINRTYPNVVNFEAVFGMEEAKWTERHNVNRNGTMANEPSKDMPLYDVTFPFIRGMAGYVDFTPGGMRNASKADFQPIYNNPLTMGTRCHQLAHYIVHDSPLTMLADNPTIYDQEKECTDFIASLPTVYDDMKVIDGKMGEYIIVARRKGNNWYIAGETNWDAREITIDPSFLPAGTYDVTAFTDGVNADKAATDYKKQTLSNVDPHTAAPNSIKVRLASGGGFAASIIKK